MLVGETGIERDAYAQPLNMSLLSTFRLSSHAPATLRQSSRCWRHTNLNSYASFRNASGRARPPPRSSNFSRPQEKRDWLAFLHRIPTQTVFWSIVGVNAGVFCAWQLANTRAVSYTQCSTHNFALICTEDRTRYIYFGLDVQEFHFRLVQSLQ